MMRVLISLVAATAIVGTAFAAPPEDADKYVMHLEFGSYDVELKEENITVTHDENLNMILRALKGGVLLQTWIETSEMKEKHVVEMVNKLNTAATVARFYIDDEQDTMIEAWYPGDYNRKQFSVFMDAWHGDTKGQYPIIVEYSSK